MTRPDHDHGAPTDDRAARRSRTILMIVGAVLLLALGGALHLIGVLPPG